MSRINFPPVGPMSTTPASTSEAASEWSDGTLDANPDPQELAIELPHSSKHPTVGECTLDSDAVFEVICKGSAAVAKASAVLGFDGMKKGIDAYDQNALLLFEKTYGWSIPAIERYNEARIASLSTDHPMPVLTTHTALRLLRPFVAK